ncbi:MAG: type I 3-dehydroquinate dehydratase [Pseudomonadota bacterium]
MHQTFPLQGVIGIVANSAEEVGEAVALNLQCIEVRADLLLSAGHSEQALLNIVRDGARAGLKVLFTLRHPTHQGTFGGSEDERIALNQRALAAGAHIVDAELGTPCADALIAAGAPVVLSHHDFSGMPDETELTELTVRMRASGAAALKLVPTAATLADGARMLRWVEERAATDAPRIGFAMGAAGASSRILTIAYGAPITYASFGASVAPGQVPIAELLEIYKAADLNAATRVYGIVGSHALTSFSPFLHNLGFHPRGTNAVYVPLQTESFEDALDILDTLRIDGVSVTTPFKEEALAAADGVDDRSTACGASNTLLVQRDGADRRLHAFNTDFDGVLLPIQSHRPIAGLKIAIMGNGGAARGAVQALKSGGASLTLFYRNAARGQPVADEFGITGALLADIDESFDVYINATTLGTDAGDPSPVPSDVFARSDQIAFEMLYQNPNSQFVQDAEAAGVRIIRGAEMLVAQGTVQFEHFTGALPGLDEFAGHFAAGQRLRF